MDEYLPWQQVILTMMDDLKKLRADMRALEERFAELDSSVTLMAIHRYEITGMKTNDLCEPPFIPRC